MALTISSAFESGSIEVVDASQPSNIQLRLVPEPHSELEDATFMQWFHFSVRFLAAVLALLLPQLMMCTLSLPRTCMQVSNVQGVPLNIKILNAGDASFSSGWGPTVAGPGYKAVCTYDKQNFFRVPDTTYDSDAGMLSIALTPEQPVLWLSYFAPYPYQRHMELVTRIGAKDCASHSVIGQSLDGRDLDLLQVGDGSGAKIWIIAQQHPGEHMAEYWTEGLLERLTDTADPVSKKLLDNATFFVVPRINPDGCFRGHLRTNAGGANLNREWCDSAKPDGTPYAAPTLERSPEVYHVLREMDATGCDCCIDVHGDEGLAYNFFASAEGIDGWTSRLSNLYDLFQNIYCDVTPDFQKVYGYEFAPGQDIPHVPAPGSAMPARGNTSQIAQRFDCLAVTLEMPFKDTVRIRSSHTPGRATGSMLLYNVIILINAFNNTACVCVCVCVCVCAG
jgi:murein tripeptide amidase MpaA